MPHTAGANQTDRLCLATRVADGARFGNLILDLVVNGLGDMARLQIIVLNSGPPGHRACAAFARGQAET